jgi:hypothetical protein
VRVLAHGLHRFKEFKIIEIIKISTDKSVRFAWSIGPQITQITQILIFKIKDDLCKSVRSVRVFAHGLHRLHGFKEFKIIEVGDISDISEICAGTGARITQIFTDFLTIGIIQNIAVEIWGIGAG